MILFGHEFAHCFLNVEHSLNEKNFMFPVLPEELNYWIFLFQFDQEVKSRCSQWLNK